MDIHLLSDTELNEAIAVKREPKPKSDGSIMYRHTKNWEWISGRIETITDGWITPVRGHWLPADFTHDRGLAMELLEELLAGMDLTVITVFLDNINHFREEVSISKLPIKRLEINLHQSDNLIRKIDEAWLEWKGK